MGFFRTDIKLYLIALSILASACQSTKNKDASTLSLHLEINRRGDAKSKAVPIYRAAPVMVNVQQNPFLDNAYLLQASIVDRVDGGFVVSLKFDRHGTLVLNTISTAYRGQRMAIYGDFGEQRWLAAPVIRYRITNGVVTFTPDASRAEAERLVQGLNKIAEELHADS